MGRGKYVDLLMAESKQKEKRKGRNKGKRNKKKSKGFKDQS